MRLALFTDRFPELSETFVSGELRELRRRGLDVAVYAGAPTVRDPTWDGGSPHPLRSLDDLVGRLRAAGTEHIHVHFAADAAVIARHVGALTGIPYSVTAHAYELFQPPEDLHSALGGAAFVTVPCAYNARLLADLGLPGAHVRMLGTDMRALARRGPPARDGPTLAVGRLVEKKGFELLVEAAAMRDLGEVVIVGEGPRRALLEPLIAARGLTGRVRLAGAATAADVRGWMERASLLVAPSVVARDGDRDALPVVLFEALAMELPVVATAVGGIPELVRAPWGRIAPGDAPGIADTVAAVRALPYRERVAAGRAGRRWLERGPTQVRAVDQLLRLIDEFRAGAESVVV